MKELLEYLQKLLKDPSDFDLHRQEHEEKLLQILNTFADRRPPTIEQMIEALEDQYPSLQTSIELIEKGDDLRTEMMESVFDENFAVEEIKKYEARISLFDKMISFDKTINDLIRNVEGVHIPTKKKAKAKVEVDGSQGSAQTILTNLQDGKNV
jgi:hypothetical protein